MIRAAVFSALIGLTGAISNNGKSDRTDRVVLDALLAQDERQAVEAIRREKFHISPDCAVCKAPCGNTSDYDPALWDALPADQLAAREALAAAVLAAAKGLSPAEKLPELIYTAVFALGYDFPLSRYQELCDELTAL